MAYSVAKITKVESWITASEYADDGTLDIDVTTCMTNGTVAEECDEWKEGILVCKVEIDQPPADILTLKIRFYMQSFMTSGDCEVVPYTDANSVSSTNAVLTTYNTAGAWYEHILSAALIAELADIGGKCYLRLTQPGTAKNRLGEVEIDMTYTTYEINGITKDFNGDALGSCEVSAFKSLGSGVYSYAGTTISNVTTGDYTIGTLGSGTYKVIAHKTGSPAVFDVTDFLTATATPSTTTTTTTV